MYVPSHSFHLPVMKNYFTSLLSITAMTCLIATTASCSDRPKEPDPLVKSVEVSPAPAAKPTPTPNVPNDPVKVVPVASALPPPTAGIFNEVSHTLQDVTRDQATLLTSLPENLSRSIDTSLATWKASGGKSTNMSESKLSLARTDFAQKVRTLSLAGEDTWESAKTDAQSSLEHLREAYEDLLSKTTSA